MEGTPVEVPQERTSECIAKQIVDSQDAQASRAALAKTNTKAFEKRSAEIAKDQQSLDKASSTRAVLETSGDKSLPASKVTDPLQQGAGRVDAGCCERPGDHG